MLNTTISSDQLHRESKVEKPCANCGRTRIIVWEGLCTYCMAVKVGVERYHQMMMGDSKHNNNDKEGTTK